MDMSTSPIQLLSLTAATVLATKVSFDVTKIAQSANGLSGQLGQLAVQKAVKLVFNIDSGQVQALLETFVSVSRARVDPAYLKRTALAGVSGIKTARLIIRRF